MSPDHQSALAEIKKLFGDLAGQDLTHADPAASFFDLGFDSLFLTQAGNALKTQFGLKITFRQLLQDFTTLGSLAAHVAGTTRRSGGASSPPPPTSATATKPPASPPELISNPAVLSTVAPPVSAAPFAPPAVALQPRADASTLERVLHAQLKVMEQQLAMLRQGRTAVEAPTGATVISAGLDAGAQVTASPTVPTAKSQSPAIAEVQAPESAPAQHGPFRPLQKTKSGNLTEAQQKHIDWLVSRYVPRTSGSREYTRIHRSHFADPRAVSGFNPSWKEMVYPIVSTRSQGANIWDIDGNKWVDVTMGFGVALLGHSPAFVNEAVARQLESGVEIGPQSPIAGDIARSIAEFTGMERVTFCNTGSEAVMAAIRLCRTVTGRNRIALFAGAYHGTFDEVLVKGTWRNGEPRTSPLAPGVAPNLISEVTVLEYGSPKSLEWIRAHVAELAAVLVEPVQSRHPGLQPRDFLHEVRRITQEADTPLIIDEVITGFRCHPGGAQAYFGVKADLATYGKVIGAGMPLGVIAGRREYMDALDGGAWNYGDDSFPEVGVTFFAGTFVRHPLAMAAAKVMLEHLKKAGPALQEQLAQRTACMIDELNAHFAARQIPLELERFTSVWYPHFGPDVKYGSLLYYHLREKGLHIWEGRPCFLSTAHTDADIAFIIDAFKRSVAEMQAGGFLAGLSEPESANVGATSAMQPGATNLPAPTARAGTLPLTAAQQEIWLAAQLSREASCAFNESCSLVLHGQLNESALRQAIREIIVRHDALRSTFSRDGKTQNCVPTLELEVPLIDLAALPVEPRAARLRELQREEGVRNFDLAAGPLIAVQLVRLAEAEHVLLMTVHHIACDGWSYDIVLRELGQLYSSCCAGTPPVLPPGIPFHEFVRWHSDQQNSPEGQADEIYWSRVYAVVPDPLDLPGDRARPNVRTFGGARVSRELPAPLCADLRQSAAKLRTTLFNYLLTAFETLLFRLSGHTDLVVGVPAAGQSAMGADSLVGHCANLLPLRLTIRGDQPFGEVLRNTQGVVLDAYEHQGTTFGALLRRLKIQRESNRTPLVSVCFNVDPPLSDIRFAGLTYSIELNPRRCYQFDLGLNVVDEGGTLTIECDFATALFDHDTIARWLGHYEQLLAGIVTSPQAAIHSLPLLRQEERMELITRWNQTAIDYPRDKTLPRLIAEQAARRPFAVAARCDGASLTYAELDRRAGQLARQMQVVGVEPDGLVGVFIERSLDMLVAVVAVLKAGGAYVPLDPEFPPDRIALMVEDAAARVIVTQSNLLSRLPPTDARIFCLDREWSEIARLDPVTEEAAQPHNLAYVIYTSGSTGKPKGVEITHRALVNFLAAMQREPGISERDVVLALTTLSFDIAGLELFLPLVSGGSVVILGRQAATDPHQLMAALRDARVTLAQATPATWRMVVESGWTGDPKLKILCGGEAMARTLADRLLGLCGELWNMYGPTETTIWSTVCRLQPGKPITIGHPIANTQVYVVDEQLQPVPLGVPGELVIGGDGVARGYRNRPQLTNERFVADHFRGATGQRAYRTGDQVRLLPSGNLEYLGRLDSQVKIRGYRIELGEIESVLTNHPNVREAVVVARTEPTNGIPRLVAYIVAKGAAHTSPTHWGSVWETLFDQALRDKGSDTAALENIDSQIFGRTASGESQAEVDAQVQEWIETTVRRIAAFHPRHLLEIGCGTGQLLLRLAPQCDEIWGTDITAAAITALQGRVASSDFGSTKFQLLQRPADHFDELPTRHFDTVVINSVTQYFPDGDYLLRVIEKAIEAASDGGRVFIGDVQSAVLMPCFHTSLELARLPAQATIAELRRAIQRRSQSEDELMIDPAWFDALRGHLPRINQTEIQLRRGRAINETTQFHYDVVLHIGPRREGRRFHAWRDGQNLSLPTLDEVLGSSSEADIGWRGIPNARLLHPIAAMKLVDSASDAATVGEIRQRMQDLPAGIQPEDLWQLGEKHGFRVQVRWSANGAAGSMDVLFSRDTAEGSPLLTLAGDEPAAWSGWKSYLNTPHRHNAPQDHAPELRAYLRKRLPEYMVPSAFVFLSEIPRTPNQKIDRRALPPPESATVETAPSVQDLPRTDTERKLVQIWCSVLGVDAVGIKDNFFDLGGHSLLAVAAFAKIEEAFGQRLPLATLFGAPTIEQLASVLSAAPSPGRKWKSLVPIQPHGTRPPLFLVHGAGGNVLLYRSLSRNLGSEIPCYGLQARGLDGKDTRLLSIEAMAASYLEEIKSCQPHGPYHIGGYCMGGTVAYEIAQRLAAEGETVALLALLDTYNFRRAVDVSAGTLWLQKIQFHMRNLASVGARDVMSYVREKTRVARDGELQSMFRRSRTNGAIPAKKSLQETNDEATLAYEPKPYPGKVTVFRTQVNYACFPDPQMGWNNLAGGGLEIVDLAVNPHAMLVEPFVGALAREIRARLPHHLALEVKWTGAAHSIARERPATSTFVGVL